LLSHLYCLQPATESLVKEIKDINYWVPLLSLD
jgi:hypothetical protein